MLTGFSVAIMAELKRERSSVNISRNSFKSYTGHLKINPKSCVKYQNPSSTGSRDIMLAKFFYCYNGRVEKGA